MTSRRIRSSPMAAIFGLFFLLGSFSTHLNAMTLSDEPGENRESIATNTPEFISKGSDIIVRENSEIVLDCKIKDLGEYVPMWKFTKRGGNKQDVLFVGNIQIQKKNGITMDNSSNGIVIKKLTADLVGDYTCEVSTVPLQKIVYNVSMMTAPIIVPSPSSGKTTVRKNERLRLECNVKPSPSPVTIQWMKNNKIIEDNSAILELSQIRSSDEGDYVCIATNEIGERRFTFQIGVQYEPEISISEKIIHGPIGNDVEIRCDVKANPRAEISWQFSNNSRVHNSIKHQIKNFEKYSILRITRVNLQDYDNYYCQANNSIGSQTVFFEVTGRPSKPKFTSPQVGSDGDSYQIDWTVFSQTPIRSYDLRMREIDHHSGYRGEWRHIRVEPVNDGEGPIRSQSFRVDNLSQMNGYEIDLEVENEHGKTRSDTFYFSSTDVSSAGTPNSWLSLCILMIPFLLRNIVLN